METGFNQVLSKMIAPITSSKSFCPTFIQFGKTTLERIAVFVTQLFQAIANTAQSLFTYLKPKVVQKPQAPTPQPTLSVQTQQLPHAPTPPPTPIHDVQFQPNDFDYTSYSQEDISDLQFAENCCSYPKLALALNKKRPHLGMHTACRKLNQFLQTKVETPPIKLSEFTLWLDRNS